MSSITFQFVLEAIRHVPALATGRMLCLGQDAPDALADLLGAGLDAYGVTEATEVAEAAERICPGRVTVIEPTSLPYPDGAFDLVVAPATGLAGDTRDDRVARLREAKRVSAGRVLLCISRPCHREAWEREAFQAGLCRDPQALRLAPINQESTAPEYLQLLWDANARPGLRDALTNPEGPVLESLCLYQFAAGLVRQNDTVLDLDCDTGWGACMLREASPCRSVTGIALDAERAAAGARAYGLDLTHMPHIDLGAADAAGVDVIVISLRALQQNGVPAHCARVLRPGGRLLVRTRGAELGRARALLGKPFLIDQCLQAEQDCIRVFDGAESVAGDGHWLLSCIRDPIGGERVPYRETVFPAPTHPTPAVEFTPHYRNPWLVHSLILGGIRVRSPRLVAELAERVLQQYPVDSADYGGALCVLAYQRLGSPAALDPAPIQAYLALTSENPHVLRWQVSLRFVLGLLHRRAGRFDLAEQYFRDCARSEFMRFGPHLGTKVTEGALEAGWLALLRDDTEAARAAWRLGIDAAARAAAAPTEDLLIQPDCPARFEMGDGLREMAMIIDNAAGCANGLHELHRWRGRAAGPRFDIHHRFQSGYLQMYRELQQRNHELSALLSVDAVDPVAWLLRGRLTPPTRIEFLHDETPGLVSVIIPLYNGKKFIERTIRSVWDQTLPAARIELIVADDGSTDGSLEVVERLREQSPLPLKIVTHPNHENRGVSATRNLCFRHAAGEYIALLDADDLYLPRRLQASIAYFETHPGCQALCALGYNVDENGNRVTGYNGTEEAGNYRAVSPDLEPPFSFEQLWTVYPIANSTVTVRRRSLGETGGYPEEMAHQAEDWLLMLKFSLYAPVAFLDEHLIHYTHHAGSYTTQYHAFQFGHGCRVEVFHLLTYWMLQHRRFRKQGIRFYRREFPMLRTRQRDAPDLRDLPGILKRAAANGLKMGPVRSARMLWNTLQQSRANRGRDHDP